MSEPVPIPPPITFHQPRFDKTIKDKVNTKIETPDPHTLLHSVTTRQANLTAIATEGFPSNVDGTHIFATYIEYAADANSLKYSPYLLPFIGFCSLATYDETKPAKLDGYPLRGTSLSTGCGVREPKSWLQEDPYGELGDQNHFPDQSITRHTKEVISIFRIRENGKKMTVQWIVDGGHACREDDCTKEFLGEGRNKLHCDEIFPAITLCYNNSKVRMMKIDEVKKSIVDKNPEEYFSSSSTSHANIDNDKEIKVENPYKTFEKKEDKNDDEKETTTVSKSMLLDLQRQLLDAEKRLQKSKKALKEQKELYSSTNDQLKSTLDQLKFAEHKIADGNKKVEEAQKQVKELVAKFVVIKNK